MKQFFQSRNLSKKILLPILGFAISAATAAQPFSKKSPIESKEIALVESFKEIEVQGDHIKIILTDNLDRQLVLYGSPKDIKDARVIIRDGKLIIDANHMNNLAELRVYIPASNIRSLVTYGETNIVSSGSIKASDLDIILNGKSAVSINYKGKLRVIPGEGYELLLSKN
jgi:hypothetical protein